MTPGSDLRQNLIYTVNITTTLLVPAMHPSSVFRARLSGQWLTQLIRVTLSEYPARPQSMSWLGNVSLSHFLFLG